MKKIAACVVTYNRKVKLMRCLDSLRKQTAEGLDIIVIDNASTDGTEQELKTMISSGAIKYFNTGKNLGGAGGFYTAIKYAAPKYEYIWIMDDDTYPESDALKELLNAVKLLNDDFGFLSSVVKWRDGSFCKMNRPWLGEDFYEHILAIENGLIPVVEGSFVSMFVKSDTVKKKGLPIPEFFIWGDDAEYSMRLADLGGYLVPKSRVLHDMEENDSIDVTTTDYRRVTRYRYYLRNRIYIAKEHHDFKKVIKYHLSCGKQILRVLLHAKDHRLLRMVTILRGFFESLFFNPQIEYLDK